jgi:exonuclease III
MQQDDYNTTVLLTQETWAKDDGDIKIDGTISFSHGSETEGRAKGGVGNVLSPKAVHEWKRAGQPDPVRPGATAKSCRIIGLKISVQDQANKPMTIFLISVYMLCSSYTDEEYDETLEQLREIIQNRPSNSTLIIGGDFNASLGIEESENYPNLGPEGNPHQNERGDILREFLEDNELCSVAKFYPKPNHNTWSFNGDGAKALQLDHILMNRTELRRTRNCGPNYNGVDSNHMTVKATLNIATWIPPKQKRKKNKDMSNEKENQCPLPKQPPTIDCSKVVTETYNKELDKALEENGLSVNPEDWEGEECQYNIFVNTIKTVAAKIAPSDGRIKRSNWFKRAKEILQNTIRKCNEATKEFNNNRENIETQNRLKASRPDLKRKKNGLQRKSPKQKG